MSKNKISSAVIIGGGIFGTSTAVQLVRKGINVTLINDGPVANGASGRSLSWLNSSRMRSDAYHRLRMAGIDRYRTLAERFPGADWLSFKGGLTWDADDATNEIDAAYDHEVKLAYDALHLAADEVKAVTPGVDAGAVTPQGAIFNAAEGWVDLPTLIKILIDEFRERGGTLVTDAGAASVMIENGRAVGARTTNGAVFPADAVLVATGPSVPKMAADAGQKIDDGTPISLLVTTKPLDIPLKAVLNTPRIAIRPGPNNTFALDSAWSEEEVGTLADGSYQVKQETLDGLLAEASNVLEGNPKLELASYGVGRKPIPGDGEPVLGELKAIPGYFVAFSHSGATLGLIVGELLACEIASGERHPMLASFRPERFA
ncbi:NAD(P)/FAD-dependent oxidoreductase [Agrobacterium vitis]|uniref:NAD(P)/FAD-dependent oxidoreductase n=1 Tax=Agrobacterium vitis TaxID=373 RepID=UPI003D2C93EB